MDRVANELARLLFGLLLARGVFVVAFVQALLELLLGRAEAPRQLGELRATEDDEDYEQLRGTQVHSPECTTIRAGTKSTLGKALPGGEIALVGGTARGGHQIDLPRLGAQGRDGAALGRPVTERI